MKRYWTKGELGDVVAACDAMAMRAREGRAERNRRERLDARNAEPATLDVDEGEREADEVVVVVDLDRWQARGAR